jgi:hypothetical protein
MFDYSLFLTINSIKPYVNIVRNKLNKYKEEILGEEQCTFQKRRECADAILTINQILHKRREENLPIYLLFIDYEKAYYSLNHDKIYKILTEEKIPPHLRQ